MELQRIGEMILRKKQNIARHVHDDRMAGVILTEEQKRDFMQLEPHIMEIRASFIHLFGEALIEHADRKISTEKVFMWGKKQGEYFFHLGVPLDEALKDTGYYRDYIWKAIEEEADALKLSPSIIFKIISIIDPLLDKAVYWFSLTYVQFHQKALENARNAFLELSVPVVPLTRGVGILPLVGNIDTARAQFLMEETLKHSSKHNFTHLIFDFSGVYIVDTMVAQQIFQVIDALLLIGVETIITGIRPEVAQTMVNLGVKMDQFKVKANLEQALNHITLTR
ncbi:STAS domain-containing protein [Metabacillus sp. RGM 3146]|uniref:STAS domain-containing protein n=1 Tax=Metabacillus sp. RGM 3146 TaxID=3401092 RepID=UPI003B9D2347